MSNSRGYFSHVDSGKPVLAGHRASKRKLHAPLSDFPATTTINTTADIFPELLWIALLFDHLGYHRAIRVAAPFRKALSDMDDTRRWYRLSELAKLTMSEWDGLTEQDGEFKLDVSEALLPLLVYPQLPFEFLRGRELDRDNAIQLLERCVGRHSNRFETPGAATIGTFVFLEAFAGKFRVPREVLEGISAIVDKADSDEAELGASGARAVALAFWGADAEPGDSWPAEFWRTNLSLSPCRTRRVRE